MVQLSHKISIWERHYLNVMDGYMQILVFRTISPMQIIDFLYLIQLVIIE